MDPAGAAGTTSAGGERGCSLERSHPRKSSSFRLRCSSLNSLRLRRVFDLFDKDGDGLITVYEISQALILLGLDSDPSKSALDSIINSFIKDGRDGLTFEDFESLHKSLNDTFFKADEDGDEYDDAGDEIAVEEDDHHHHHHHSSKRRSGSTSYNDEEEKLAQEESDLTEAFKVFDEDGDGFISAKELQVVLDKLGLPEAKEMDSVERMISSVDRNQDGLVDFFEFKDMMRNAMFVHVNINQ
ncbi:hypothetical protein Ancab_031346 [Ancistrocladus abbreviatus]